MRFACALILASASTLATSCVVEPGAKADVAFSLDTATKYVHRGMVQNENGVIQPEAVMRLPAKQDGAIIVRGWANMDLSNDTGDAWLPDGHAGKFSQIDFNLLYEQTLEDNIVITSGLVSYNLPNGLEFPFGERGATTEFLVEGRMQLDERYYSLVPSLSLHYDFDEVNGLYARAAVERAWKLDEDWTVSGDFGFAWMDGNQSNWNYAQPSDASGIADVTLKAAADYKIDDHTFANGFVQYSRVMDSEFRDWFDVIGIDADQLFLGVGVTWAY